MADGTNKSTTRRNVIREKCPDQYEEMWRQFRASGALRSMGLAALFCLIALSIVTLRDSVVPYRPGQYASSDIHGRVKFVLNDPQRLNEAKRQARESQPRIYMKDGDFFGDTEKNLLALPDWLAGKTIDQIDANLAGALELDGNAGILTEFSSLASNDQERAIYTRQVQEYIADLRKKELWVVSKDDYLEEQTVISRRNFIIAPISEHNKELLIPAIDAQDAKSKAIRQDMYAGFKASARVFTGLKPNRIAAYTFHTLRPFYKYNTELTTAAQNAAETNVPQSQAVRTFERNQVIVPKGLVKEVDWLILKAEKEQFTTDLKRAALKGKLGLATTIILMTVVLSWYVSRYQPHIMQNSLRVIALGTLLVSMLFIAQLAAVGNSPIYYFGVAPTILVAMILAIAYDQRFAIGIASMHGMIVTTALEQGIGFFLILWVGILTCCFLIGEIRTRIKLIMVGGATAAAMVLGTIAAGAISLDPREYILRSCIYSAAAGISVGFVVLGILPIIEKMFRITTGMTLLELADLSRPLLRRLALEAPGTDHHSQQVARLAETACDAIGGNSLLCRVASYYHDIGKINKPEYFIENQSDGNNRHYHLTASMSYHIIIGHVKDGIALAREYKLPPVILPFIQQHHGTTLIEYFFDKAKKQQIKSNPDAPAISEEQFRYGGPKPRTREVAILMLADAAESATRAEREPSSTRITQLIHDLATNRLEDGQFDECGLTLQELRIIQASLVKTLTGIYHGRIAYPSNARSAQAAATPEKDQNPGSGAISA